MTKEELEQLRNLKIEIKVLKDQLNDLPDITDSVKGSAPDYPYINRTIVIEGADSKLDRELYNKLKIKILKRKNEINRMEDWLDSVADSQIRTILKLYYKDGLTWKEVAFKIGEHDESYPRRKARDFLKLADFAEKKVVK